MIGNNQFSRKEFQPVPKDCLKVRNKTSKSRENRHQVNGIQLHERRKGEQETDRFSSRQKDQGGSKLLSNSSTPRSLFLSLTQDKIKIYSYLLLT